MKKYIVISVLPFVGLTNLCAAVYTWTGDAGDGLWGTSANWDLDNGYYPQSGSDTAVIGENAGTIVWSAGQNYFGATHEITLEKNSEILCQLGGGTGDLYFDILNLYGTFSAEGTNALGFQRDFTVNFGNITESSSGLLDFSGFTGLLWVNNHTVTVTANASVKGSGEIELVKLAGSLAGGAVTFGTEDIRVLDSNGNPLVLNTDASSTEDLAMGEYALVSSAAGNGGVKILYAAPVPEPSAFGMLAGLGALALVASRRRRK
ncbi:MAG: PEP-CTERM sorting domain-containing protein [Opitutales bacterium]|nr:PEP-CTERM sorting domain-containing protein [Opitutales bacterium]